MFQYTLYMNKLTTGSEAFLSDNITPYFPAFTVQNCDDKRVAISIWTELEIYDYLYSISFPYNPIIKKYAIVELL